jgi:hypothetical protein
MPNFTDILNQDFDTMKPPKPLPPGEYLAIIADQPEITQRGKNNNHCVVFPIKLVQALDQSPKFQSEIAEALDGKSLSDIRLQNTLWLTPDAAYRLKAFLQDHLGIDAKNASEAIAQSPGKQLIVTIGHYVSNKEGEAPRVGMEIRATAKAA